MYVQINERSRYQRERSFTIRHYGEVRGPFLPSRATCEAQASERRGPGETAAQPMNVLRGNPEYCAAPRDRRERT